MEWPQAMERIAVARRTLVLGATDVGKSSLIRLALEAEPDRLQLLDLDPGQKMVGPPGTVSTGSWNGERLTLDRFIFHGSTSGSALGPLVGSARKLRGEMGGSPLIANTAGFVKGFGARLQAATVQALEPDLIVAIAYGDELDPVLQAAQGIPVLRLSPLPLARRKTPGQRRRIRQDALTGALAGADRLLIPPAVRFWPSPPPPLTETARPICALASASGEDMRIAVLESNDEHGSTVYAARPSQQVATVKLGKMWAEPGPAGWRLLDQLRPATQSASL
jgi:polynucleotide 5'-hydroxyl-kinase GRC3/NOL9